MVIPWKLIMLDYSMFQYFSYSNSTPITGISFPIV